MKGSQIGSKYGEMIHDQVINKLIHLWIGRANRSISLLLITKASHVSLPKLTSWCPKDVDG